MPKIGISKAPKTFTISLNNLVWLDEYCNKKGVKVSTFVDKLINRKTSRKKRVKSHQNIGSKSCIKFTGRN